MKKGFILGAMIYSVIFAFFLYGFLTSPRSDATIFLALIGLPLTIPIGSISDYLVEHLKLANRDACDLVLLYILGICQYGTIGAFLGWASAGFNRKAGRG